MEPVADPNGTPEKALHLTVDEFFELVEKFDPNQPRDPGGEDGGQWVADGGDAPTTPKPKKRRRLKEVDTSRR